MREKLERHSRHTLGRYKSCAGALALVSSHSAYKAVKLLDLRIDSIPAPFSASVIALSKSCFGICAVLRVRLPAGVSTVVTDNLIIFAFAIPISHRFPLSLRQFHQAVTCPTFFLYRNSIFRDEIIPATRPQRASSPISLACQNSCSRRAISREYSRSVV